MMAPAQWPMVLTRTGAWILSRSGIPFPTIPKISVPGAKPQDEDSRQNPSLSAYPRRLHINLRRFHIDRIIVSSMRDNT